MIALYHARVSDIPKKRKNTPLYMSHRNLQSHLKALNEILKEGQFVVLNFK